MTATPLRKVESLVRRLGDAYRLRWTRRRLMWRALTGRRALEPVANRTGQIQPGAILAFATIWNEAGRLPHFLDHYRGLGVAHFLVVDNASDDGSAELLGPHRDISVWTTRGSYRAARFGADWMTWLQMRYGHGHWCLTVDADELLVYPHWTERGLPALTARLEATGAEAMGALMLDLYSKGPVDAALFAPGGDPLECLRHFDPGPYRVSRKPRELSLRVQGGPRDRVFFAGERNRAPTLNKLPLVRWSRRFAWRNATHSILPRRLNLAWDGPGDERLSGVLLHTKFLPSVVTRAAEEKRRGEHFQTPGHFDAYYDALAAGPDLWFDGSADLRNWQQLVELGLMSAGGWD